LVLRGRLLRGCSQRDELTDVKKTVKRDNFVEEEKLNHGGKIHERREDRKTGMGRTRGGFSVERHGESLYPPLVGNVAREVKKRGGAEETGGEYCLAS